MRALRRMRRPDGRRLMVVTGLVVVAVGGAVACQPADLSSASVAYTTSQTATQKLERQHVKVSWLSCSGGYGGNTPSTTAGRAPSPTRTSVVTVDCKGQTNDGKDITVKGRVTRAVDGKCVRGDLRATVGGKQWFHVSGLGNCNAAGTPTTPGRPRPTVTVTKTIWCQGDPTCWPARGK